MDAQCRNTKYPLIENIPELNSNHKSTCTRVLHDSTVLVTLLRCIVNCMAYPIQALCAPFPQAGVRSQGTRIAFSNIDGESVEGMKSN